MICGGSRGLGRAIALRLGGPRTVVVINYRSDDEAAAQTADAVTALGGRATVIRADVGTDEGVSSLFDEIERAGFGLDVYVHNAYAKVATAPMSTDADGWHRAMAVGPLAFLRCAQRAVPLMKMKGHGRILATSSVAPQRLFNTEHGDKYFPMAVAKGSIEVTARYLAVELAPFDITVNVVAPGYMKTDNFPGAGGEQLMRRVVGRTPLGRVPDPDEVAAVFAFLASDDGSWVTGQTILSDGGFALI